MLVGSARPLKMKIMKKAAQIWGKFELKNGRLRRILTAKGKE
jgi:hypothetical protein